MARNSVAYDEDFFAWTQEQSRLLREGALSQIDAENVAGELESMGRNNRRELGSRLTVILHHMLKWQFQSGGHSRSWIVTVNTQRDEIAKIVADSPSLRPVIREILLSAYASARRDAAVETRLSLSRFPVECPFSLEDVLTIQLPGDNQAA
ncbi:MAG TPA: DUF29 domain-containing protein [Stellaceae bacterium]|jgi:hypothetical protein